MQKTLLYILIPVLLSGCAEKKNSESIIETKYKECCNQKVEEKIKTYSFDKINESKERNIHKLFEEFLIEKKILEAKTQNDYIVLFDRIQNGQFNSDLTQEFSKELKFDTSLFFMRMYHLNCLAKFFIQEKQTSKSTWQFQILKDFENQHAYGNYKTNTKYIIDAVKKIPKEEFNKIYYRQIFINALYIGIGN